MVKINDYIRLTNASTGEPMVINPERIAAIETVNAPDGGSRARIHFGSGFAFVVDESYQVVLDMLKEE